MYYYIPHLIATAVNECRLDGYGCHKLAECKNTVGLEGNGEMSCKGVYI